MSGLDFDVAIVVHFTPQTNRTATVSAHRFGDQTSSQSPCTESQFFGLAAPTASSIPAAIMLLRRERFLLAENRSVRATLTLGPPECMMIRTADDGANNAAVRLMGRGVALVRLLAERIGFDLLLQCADYNRYDRGHRGLAEIARSLSDFRMDFGERPWLKEMTVQMTPTYRYVIRYGAKILRLKNKGP